MENRRMSYAMDVFVREGSVSKTSIGGTQGGIHMSESICSTSCECESGGGNELGRRTVASCVAATYMRTARS